jgi:hypothetical protein
MIKTLKNMKKLFPLALIMFVLFSSCQKDAASSENTPDASLSKNKLSTSSLTTTIPTVIMNVGTGTGNLVVDGTKFIKADAYTINIKAGTYSSITIQNVNNTGLVTVLNSNGLVTITGNSSAMYLTNVSNLTVSGYGTAGITNGFVFSNNNYRALIVTGLTHNLTLMNFTFENIGDYVIYFATTGTVYDGTNNTCFYDISLDNMTCTNTQSFLQLAGDITNGVVTGLVKNLQIQGLNYSNSNCGVVVYVGDADSYNIHNNVINNINQTNTNHNGIFMMIGNGSFHDNIVSNHEGNAIRAWGVTVGTTPKDVLIYNNTVYNSIKYSAFEVQSFTTLISPGKSTFINASVYNNTCGNLNLSKNWYGVVVDVYSLFGGYCKVYDNTGFNFPAPNPSSYIVSQQGTTVPILTANKYYTTAALAGIANVSALKIY